MTGLLYHITRKEDAESIFREGLKQYSAAPARKKADKLAAEAGGSAEMRRDTPTEKAERWFDETIRHARSAVDGAEEYPRHDDAVFFWTSENRALRAYRNTSWAGVIVEVRLEAIPCDCAVGPIHELDSIFQSYFDAAREGGGSADRDEQLQVAKEWWRKVRWYRGGVERDHEVWCGCDVPPHAIERIYNPDTGRTMFAPPDDPDQSRFLEFPLFG